MLLLKKNIMNLKKSRFIQYVLLYILLLVVLSMYDGINFYNFKEKLWLNNPINTIVFLSAYLGSIFFLLLLIVNKSKVVRYISYALLFLFLSLSLSYTFINNYGFGRIEAETFLNEILFASEAVSTYFWSGACATGISALFIVLLMFVNSKIKKTNTNYLVVIIFVIVCVYHLFSNTGAIAQRFCIFLKVPSSIYYASHNNLYKGERNNVDLSNNDIMSKNILFVVDESIRGDKLSINNNDLTITPFLKKFKDKIINYNIACSSTNKSATSNLVLQVGIKDSLPDRKQELLKTPNIFQYAKKSGYRTIFINSQESRQQNYGTKYDNKFIDSIIFVNKTFNDIKKYQRDFYALDCIKNLFNDSIPTFIYFNKYGSHFNYETCYPKSEVIYSPVMKLGEFTDDKVKMENSYYNAIHWSVDKFFEKLISYNIQSNSTIVYTSDHGQNLLDDPNVKGTHCNVFNAVKYEGNVPMFIIERDSIISNKLNSVLLDNINNVQHKNIFPTMLILMGYKKEDVENIYGNSLFSSINRQRRTFLSGDIFGESELFKINTFKK